WRTRRGVLPLRRVPGGDDDRLRPARPAVQAHRRAASGGPPPRPRDRVRAPRLPQRARRRSRGVERRRRRSGGRGAGIDGRRGPRRPRPGDRRPAQAAVDRLRLVQHHGAPRRPDDIVPAAERRSGIVNRLEDAEGGPYGAHHLPYGVFSTAEDPGRRLGVRIGEHVLDLRASASAGRFAPRLDAALSSDSLNALMAAGPDAWRLARRQITDLLASPRLAEESLTPIGEARMHLPFTVADYVDFYASEHHATNLGRLFRPDGEALLPNWKRLPVGYHGRAGTVVPSGTPITRPSGQRKGPDGAIEVGPSRRLGIEAEIGFVVGTPTGLGAPVGPDAFAEHVFGVVLVNDWSARDIQAWEYQPLGPFLGKSFATSIGHWVTPL